uniref:RUS family member 1 n=1 Tax=Anabas testudineus TaxID=64144 RepID=A0A3Q1JQ10_ANATE
MEKDRGVVLATERYGSAEYWKYLAKDGAIQRRRDGSEGAPKGNSVIGVFKSVFLPQGYPESVSDDYLQYQFWDTVQAFSSSLSGTLATQASLKGVGVGNQEATVAAATVTWLLRDGTGMLGRILFAWQKGYASSNVEDVSITIKTTVSRVTNPFLLLTRLFADVLNDIAMFMEILAPYFPACFTLIVCSAGVFKSIVGVAGGATRAALTVHQARRDNMADISAKDGSQETLVNLAGLLVSLILIPLVTDNPILTLSLFFLFTILHLFANYKAVRSVVMETFNEARLSIVLHQYLSDKRILTPFEANQREPVFLEFRKIVPIRLGVRLQDVVQSPEELHLALKENNRPYLLGIQNGSVCVCLGPEATVQDEIKVMCQALWLRSMLSCPTSQQQSHWEMVHESHKLMDMVFSPFLKAAGWDIKRTLLDWDEWRVEWKTKSN